METHDNLEGIERKLVLTVDELKDVTNKVILDHFKKGHLTGHHIGSFNDFMLRKIPDIIAGFNPIVITHQYMPELSELHGIPMFKYHMEIILHNHHITKPMINEKDGSTKVMTPMDARNRNMTYAAPITIDMTINCKTYNPETQDYVHETKQMNNIPLGSIPIMVGSQYCVLNIEGHRHDECPYDMYGYFIINGTEKVIIPQDRIAENKTCVFINNKDPAYSYIAEIRSVQENCFSVPKTTSVKLSSKPNQYGYFIRVNIHHIKHDVPLFIIFRAFGIESDRDIMNYIVHDVDDPDNEDVMKELMGSAEESNTVLYKRDAMEYLVRYLNINGYPREYLFNKVKRMEILNNVLQNECLPHVGPEFYKKALYLGHMVNKMVKCSIKKLPLEERDSYMNKRIDTPGILMANLMRQYYGKLVKELKNMVQKDIKNTVTQTVNMPQTINKVNIPKLIKPTTITSGLKFSLATGNWGIKNNKTKQGVAQVLNRLTYNATVSHERRINTPIDKTAKLVQPRKLHGTQVGIICPAETPEGVSVGLVKNMSIMSSITISSNSMHLRDLLYNTEGMKVFDGTNIEIFANKATKVFVNGDMVGAHDEPLKLYEKIRLMKRRGVINVYTAVVWNIALSEIILSTEGGRFVRPFFIVDQNGGADCQDIRIKREMMLDLMTKKADFTELVTGNYLGKEESEDELKDTSILEYLDVEEINTAMIAMHYRDLRKGFNDSMYPVRYTHLEIDPSLLMGVMAASIPFGNHNQAPRLCYQASMAKQAIGVYTTNFRKRYDTMAHVLNYGQKPLVNTKAAELINNDKLASGVNCIVAIATQLGQNVEDSVVINQSAVDRGLFHSTYYKTYKEQCGKNHSTGEEEFFTKPNPKNTIKMKPYNYDKLENDGFVKENTFVKTGDVLIGKCMPQKQGDVILNKDVSLVLKDNESGYVDSNYNNDRNFANVNGDGYTFAKVRIRNNREPEIGDKFSSRHGQKGTVGMVVRQEDMPFTSSGIVPDIIMNPHALPSRMTLAHLIECLTSKACVELGTFADATPFRDVKVEEVAEALEDVGLERYGNEIMYNPRTGEQFLTDIYIGPTFYQRLKHMSVDKIHSRAANGPVVLLHHQSVEGRQRSGGLRLGEMETEVLWSHGVMGFLKERFMECADNYRVFTCRRCGMLSNVNPAANIYSCKYCRNNTQFAESRVPYAFKLLMQEIQTMSISTRFITSNKKLQV